MYLKALARKGSAAYWSKHIVAEENWANAQQSLDYFLWRNSQYPGYIKFMPVDQADNLTVLDFGCGPGNDLVGFHEFSQPKRLIGVDVSKNSLEIAKRRLQMHECDYLELYQIDEKTNKIPLPNDSVDLINSGGVLHHVSNIEGALKELRRVLKPTGKMQIMVYNYQSIWLHLYVAYQFRLVRRKYDNDSVEEAFRKTTDGPNCPISRCYKPDKFVNFVSSHGFSGEFLGSAMSLIELEHLSQRLQALRDIRLPAEHREFLSSIKFDDNGFPTVNGVVAGIDACYKFKKI